MSKLSVNVNVSSTPPAGPDGAEAPLEKLLRVFNELRDELVSTLWFILGNRDDALDAAQEAFLKCWKSPSSLENVRDLRACLRGKNLACWCKLGQPCHADILIEMANSA